MEDILAEIRRHFLRLLETPVHQLVGLIERIVPSQSLPVTLLVLLQQQRTSSELVCCGRPSHSDGHRPLLPVKHHPLHVGMFNTAGTVRLSFRLRLEVGLGHLSRLSP